MLPVSTGALLLETGAFEVRARVRRVLHLVGCKVRRGCLGAGATCRDRYSGRGGCCTRQFQKITAASRSIAMNSRPTAPTEA